MSKYERWYQIITQSGKKVREPGLERHHIVPESLGGSDDPHNVTFITPREHFICHWLLTKVYKTGEPHWKMINALRMMRAENPNQKRYNTKITSRVYDKLKREYAKLQSERVSGENNPMHGAKFYRSADGKMRQRAAISGDKNGAKQPNARKKISESKLGKSRGEFTDEWRTNLSKNHKSKQTGFNGAVSEKTKQKIGNALRGRKQDPETVKKKADAIRGLKREKLLCPHCNKLIAVNTYPRWHGDNCKHK